MNNAESYANSVECIIGHFKPVMLITADKDYILQDQDLHTQTTKTTSKVKESQNYTRFVNSTWRHL